MTGRLDATTASAAVLEAARTRHAAEAASVNVLKPSEVAAVAKAQAARAAAAVSAKSGAVVLPGKLNKKKYEYNDDPTDSRYAYAPTDVRVQSRPPLGN